MRPEHFVIYIVVSGDLPGIGTKKFRYFRKILIYGIKLNALFLTPRYGLVQSLPVPAGPENDAVSVICSEREDGIKLSARSEREDIHAGELMRKALEGLGNGGGHAAMAGGLVKAENIPLLGRFPQDALRERFLHAWEEMTGN